VKKITLFVVIVLFFYGCSDLEIVQPNDNHSHILEKERSCSNYSLEEAKQQAKLELSKSLYSVVYSEEKSNKYSSKYNDSSNYGRSFNQNYQTQTSLLVITPKFINLTKQSSLFGDDTYCATVIIDEDLAYKYLDLMKKDYNTIIQNVKLAVSQTDIENKKYKIKEVLIENRNLIKEYEKLYKVVRVLGLSSNLPLKITELYFNSITNAKPVAKIVLNTKSKKYKNNFKFSVTIKDENPNDVNITWFINQKKYANDVKTINFKSTKKQTLNIKVVVVDNQGLSNATNYVLKLQNYRPHSCFKTKSFYYKGERLRLKSCAYDPERDLVSIKYYLYDLNTHQKKRIRNKTRLNLIGQYRVVQVVTDKYGAINQTSKNIQVENKFITKLKLNMSEYQVKNLFGEPRRENTIEYHFLSFDKNDFAFEYGSYWLIFNRGYLKCAVYNNIYNPKWHCKDYIKQEYKIIDFSDNLAFNL